MCSEREFNQPSGEPDPKFTDCEDCTGGTNYVESEGELVKEICQTCNGDGWLLIED